VPISNEGFFVTAGLDMINTIKTDDEARYKKILTLSSEPIIIVDMNGNIVDFSDLAPTTYGYTKSEFDGLSIKDIDALHSQEQIVNNIRSTTQTPSRFETKHIKKDGTVIDVEVSIVRMDICEKAYVYSSIKDITLLKSKERELRENREKWIFSVEANGDGFWEWDMENNNLFLSPMWKKMLGYDEDELINSFGEWESRVHRDDIEGVMSKLEPYLKGENEVYKAEFRMLCKDGSYKWVLARGVIFKRDKNGMPSKMIGTHQDISYIKEREKFIMDQKDRLSAIFNSQNDISVITDGKFLLNANQAFLNFFGYNSVTQFKDDHNCICDFFEDNDSIEQDKLIRKIDKDRWVNIILENQDLDYKVSMKNRIFRVYGKNILSNENEYIFNFIDITNDYNYKKRLEQDIATAEEKIRKQYQDLLHASKKASMGELVGIIAHQLKQPLNAIMLSAQLFQMDIEELEADIQEEVDKFAKRTSEQIIFMSKTIDELKDFFRPDKTIKPFTTKEAVEKALGILGKNISGKGITIIKEYADSSVILQIESELQQVVMNILNNAKDALVANKITNPFIKISTTLENGNARIVIEDNGGGIPEDVIDKVFDSYFTTKGEQGTGIGLSLSKMIVENSMHGKISVTNTDAGASFTIEIPTLAYS